MPVRIWKRCCVRQFVRLRKKKYVRLRRGSSFDSSENGLVLGMCHCDDTWKKHFSPPGCLPLPRGNVRTEQQVSIYEHFQHIQRPPNLCCPAKLLRSAHLNIFFNLRQNQRNTFLTRAGLRKSQCSPYVSQIILYSRTHFPSSNRNTPTWPKCAASRGKVQRISQLMMKFVTRKFTNQTTIRFTALYTACRR